VLSLLVLLAVSGYAAGEVNFPAPNPNASIRIVADRGARWEQGTLEVWWLRGQVHVNQDSTDARSAEAVLWIERNGELGDRHNRVIAYLEHDVAIEHRRVRQGGRLVDQSWLGGFHTISPIDIRVRTLDAEPPVKPEIYKRAIARRDPPAVGVVRPVQFSEDASSQGGAEIPPPGQRRIRAFPRSEVEPNIQSFSNHERNEWVVVIDGGANLIVDNVQGLGSVDISADRIVAWTAGGAVPELARQTFQSAETPLEFYLEGNLVFRQGDRVIYADRMYYDVRNEVGTVLSAEVLTPVPEYEGLIRLRADLVRMTSRDRFMAENTFVTSSRLGRPGYRLEAGNVLFEDQQQLLIDPFTRQPQIDPLTGEPIIDHQRLATSRNNVVYLGEVPVFYWPVFATDLTEPQFFIRRVRVKNDRVFGTQILTDWDTYQLLGIQSPPAGTRWDTSLDYLSERGLGGGTTFSYDRTDLLGYESPYFGFVDAWAVDDHGLDNLGLGRRNIVPDREFRFRTLARHRHELPGDFRLSAELGWISDRNFLEQYFENEWDEFKDQITGLELKHTLENISWSVTADARLNDFFTQTEWLPRGDHFWIGQSLWADRLTWFEHTSVGYGRLRILSPPTDPQDLANFTLLPWEITSSGERVATRQEIDVPLVAGPVKVVPYALGELAHWGEDLDGDDIQRAYGQVGLRASVPIWRANPALESALWNVHGVAHKMVFETEVFYADASQNLDEFPLYDPVDDDSIEAFRNRIATTTFNGTIPTQFDERYFAMRTGLARWVASPSTEIADDLTAMRVGLRQRWQTKRGLPGERRIIDWIVLDTNATWFPDDVRDNFGEPFGLVDYDFRWHVGDRLTFLSDGFFDFFDQGAQLVTVGAFLERPPRGNLYMGFRDLEGPIKSRVILASYSYRMSPKWISSMGTAVDVAGNGNIGQYLALTRVGESLLVSVGANFDASKDNFGVNLAVEPRFLPRTRLGNIAGAQIPVAGAYGLE